VSFLGIGDDFFLGPVLSLSPNTNCGSVCVVGTDVNTLVPSQFLKSHPDIGLDIFHQVPQMNRTVGIGQGGGNQNLTFAHYLSNWLFPNNQDRHSTHLACLEYRRCRGKRKSQLSNASRHF
jgi:hypothetical protein